MICGVYPNSLAQLSKQIETSIAASTRNIVVALAKSPQPIPPTSPFGNPAMTGPQIKLETPAAGQKRQSPSSATPHTHVENDEREVKRLKLQAGETKAEGVEESVAELIECYAKLISKLVPTGLDKESQMRALQKATWYIEKYSERVKGLYAYMEMGPMLDNGGVPKRGCLLSLLKSLSGFSETYQVCEDDMYCNKCLQRSACVQIKRNGDGTKLFFRMMSSTEAFRKMRA